MPELPEVETVKRGLEPNILGKQIVGADVYRRDLRIEIPSTLEKELTGARIDSIKRRSKYLLIDYGKKNLLVIHLGMSGKLLYSKVAGYKKQKHDHLKIKLNDDNIIIFNDARRFGLVTLIEKDSLNEHKLFSHLGAEPLTDGFNGQYLQEKLKNKTINIKQAIMDSKNLVGVGNIYASESLFRTGINPQKNANKISLKKLNELANNIKQVLSEAIESGGSTLRDYVRSDGDVGYFQHNFRVYGRENQPCVICSTPIKRIVQQGRSTFFCPKCQK